MPQSKKRKVSKKRKPAVKPRAAPVMPESLIRYSATLDIPIIRKKPRLLSLLFCDFASTTEDRKINLLGVFDRVYVDPENHLSPPFVLYARTAEAFEDNLWVRVYDPDDQPRAEIKFDAPEIKLDPDRDPTVPIQVQFTAPIRLKLDKEGTYWFDLAYRDFSLGGAGLQVMFRKMEEGKNATDTNI